MLLRIGGASDATRWEIIRLSSEIAERADREHSADKRRISGSVSEREKQRQNRLRRPKRQTANCGVLALSNQLLCALRCASLPLR